jgi:hypothetical protein
MLFTQQNEYTSFFTYIHAYCTQVTSQLIHPLNIRHFELANTTNTTNTTTDHDETVLLHWELQFHTSESVHLMHCYLYSKTIYFRLSRFGFGSSTDKSSSHSAYKCCPLSGQKKRIQPHVAE